MVDTTVAISTDLGRIEGEERTAEIGGGEGRGNGEGGRERDA